MTITLPSHGGMRPGGLSRSEAATGRTATAPVATRQGTDHDDPNLPIYAVITLLLLTFPLSFQIGTLLLTGSRVMLLILTPVLLIGLLAGRYGAIRRTDILFALFFIWFALAVLIHTPGRFVTYAGSNFLIMAGAYLTGRCAVRGPRAFRQLIWLYGGLVLLSLPFALYEMTTSEMPIPRLLDHIPGVQGSPDLDYPARNALERVQFTFVHPIHYGLFCCYIFAMVAVGLRGSLPSAVRWPWALAIALCCFTSGSSGPFAGILIAVMLIFYGALSGGRWTLLIWSSGILYALLEVLSNRPAYYVIVEKLAFNPGTAYGRRLILEAGLAQAMRTPLFGTSAKLPLPPWMTGSLDNYWLLLAVAYGIPAFVFLFGAYVHTLVQACRSDLSATPVLAALRQGWVIGLLGSMFALATVAIWSELLSLTFLILGSGQWLLTLRTCPADAVADPVTARTGLPYSRFPLRVRGSGPAPA